jgi:hypothetical protein
MLANNTMIISERFATELLANNQLGGKSILRHVFEMGLQKQDMQHFHAWLCFKLTQKVST